MTSSSSSVLAGHPTSLHGNPRVASDQDGAHMIECRIIRLSARCLLGGVAMQIIITTTSIYVSCHFVSEAETLDTMNQVCERVFALETCLP
jgi:hypothetical protein